MMDFDSTKLNENQVERYKLGVVALQKSVNDVDLQLSYFTRSSTVHYLPDPIGDLMFNGVASDVFRGSITNGLQADGAFRLNPAHTLRVGLFGSAEKTRVATNYGLLPLDGSTDPISQILPDVPFAANDTSVLLGWLGSAYVSDEWKITNNLTVNAGLRFDQMWQYQTANQLSPRLSVTYQPVETTIFHAGYARFFTPPVQVIAAPTNTNLFTSCLGIPTCTTALAPEVPPPYRPLLPERATVYDIGVTQKVLPGLELGADVYLKQTRDLLDDGQFGAALVLNGFNYEQAQNVGVELKAVYTNGNFRAYANWAWANQRATNIITNQYLFGQAELRYISSNWIYTDHSQVYTASGGVSYLWNGTRFSADLIYGSGLRAGDFNTDHNAPYAQVNTGLSHEFLIPGWAPIVARFDVINLFDTSYAIRNDTGIGVFAPQYGPRRAYYFGLAQKFGPGANSNLPVGAVRSPGYGRQLASRGSDGLHGTPMDAVWTWTGFYVGANAGYAWGRFSTDTVFTDATFGTPVGPALASSNSSSRVNRGLIGGTSGYNWQMGMWLAGLETDLVFSHQRAPTAAACHPVICNPAIPGLDPPVSIGAEVAVATDWTAKLEYLYYQFGNVAGTFPSGTAYESKFDMHTLRVGLNRQLDWGKPGSAASWTGDSGLLASGNWNAHGQVTFIGQGYGRFPSPYFGDNSLFGGNQYKNTTSATAFVGMRPWAGTEIYVNPEFMQGSGLSETFGLGGFPNGEAQKSGFPIPRMNIGRVFIRQTFGLGGEQETMEDGPNQLAGKQDISRITITAGKFQVTDLFDGNSYSHDPRTSFLNWSFQCCGAYDWTMDKVGYTWGAAVELNQKYWAFRTGYFLVPVLSNDNRFDARIPKVGEYIGELELRYSLLSQPGKLRLMGWANVGNAGSYSEAVAEPLDTPNYPDIALTRQIRTNYGFVVNVEQALTDQLGLFSRVSWNAGKTEILGWTDINESFSLGTVLRGKAWGRPDDKVGVAGAINGLSPEARAYFAAGGLGILIGDGQLNYRREKILEAYYAYSLNKWSVLTFDYQFIADPAYNADRGPVSFYALRFHAEF